MQNQDKNYEVYWFYFLFLSNFFKYTKSLNFFKLFTGRYAPITTCTTKKNFREILINNMLPTYFCSKSYAFREYKVSYDRRMIL